MKPAYMTKPTAIASTILVLVLVLVPFHALLTVAASTVTGHYEYLRLWKDILLLTLIPLVAATVWKTPGLWQRLRPQLQYGWLFAAIGCYVVLQFALGFLALAKGQVNGYALLYAWIIDLRPLLIFVLAWVIAAQSLWLRARWRRWLLWPAILVIGFGLLQATVLPADFLRHFGYGVSTIAPYETIDEKLDYVRIQSTLRGSNPLGAYLVLAMSALLVLLAKRPDRTGRRAVMVGMLVAGSVVLAASYSRSAYIGLILAMLALALLAVRGRRAQRRLWIGLAALVLLTSGVFAALRNNDSFQNTFFHTNEQSRSATSSNQQRASALQSGVRDVVHEPFGRGPGTAGPASVHNLLPGRIAENYYLQIGQETGWLGLGLFVAISFMVAKRLWQRRADPLARTLLISLVGLSFINLVQHAWADDTLALVWWGFAGIALAPLAAPAILKGKDDKTKKTLHQANQSDT